MKTFLLSTLLAVAAPMILGSFTLNAQAGCITRAQAQSQINTKHNQNLALLGNPVGSLTTIGNIGAGSLISGWRQAYQMQDNAAIFISECGGTGAHIVQGFIRMKYDAINGISALGFPTTDEAAYSNQYFHGRQSKFERGVMLYENGATWEHGTYAILNTAFMGSQLIAQTTERDQTGGIVAAFAQGLTPNTQVNLYVNSYAGQIPLDSGKTDAKGFIKFNPRFVSNNDAGFGNVSGYLATLEVDDGHNKLAVTGVWLN